jgi:para-nitrobenzyl esterase
MTRFRADTQGVSSMITRRDVSKGIAAIGFGALSSRIPSPRAQAAAQSSPEVKTSAGTIAGLARGGVLCFLGIPYGASTAADSRFMPPRPALPWSGVRAATVYGDTCPQVPLGLSPFAKKSAADEPPPAPTAMQKQLGMLFTRPNPQPKQSEDCLVLNVWTPAIDSAKRPVMVWLHGGGFAVGSASNPAYDGARLAAGENVVVVSINHRLNVFGYLYLGGIAGDAFAQSGNVGMLDIVAALRWVRDNIGEFGGDPGNVTLFGESGGAGKVSVMCAMPAAKGLFHKAIMQSGPCLQIADKARGTAIANQLLKDLGLSPKQLSQLQSMDALKLAAAADAAEVKVVPRVLGFGPMGLVPLVDGVILPHHPFDTVASPESANVPFMVGSTKDEAVLFAAPLPKWGQFTEADIVEFMRPVAGARAQQAVDLYKRIHSADSPSYLLVDMITDFWMRQAANRVAEMKVMQEAAPAFVYVLEWQVNSELRTPHGTDVALAFDNVNASPIIGAAPGAQQISDQMSAAWAAFARTGNPGNAKIPHWPAYSHHTRANMLFDAHSRVVDDYGKEAREFWEA